MRAAHADTSAIARTSAKYVAGLLATNEFGWKSTVTRVRTSRLVLLLYLLYTMRTICSSSAAVISYLLSPRYIHLGMLAGICGEPPVSTRAARDAAHSMRSYGGGAAAAAAPACAPLPHRCACSVPVRGEFAAEGGCTKTIALSKSTWYRRITSNAVCLIFFYRNFVPHVTTKFGGTNFILYCQGSFSTYGPYNLREKLVPLQKFEF